MKTLLVNPRARGFSLIELMISIVIGMLALMFATRMVVNAEVNKQAAVGGSDSMQNGIIGLFSIEKDLQQAGWGLNDPLINGCDTVFSDASGYALLGTTRAGVAITPLAPAVIQSNGTAPDVVAIYAGSSMGNTAMVRVANNYAAGAGSIDIDRAPYGFNGTNTVATGGDAILVAPEVVGSSKCALAQVSGISAPSGQNRLAIASGGNNRFNSGSLGVAFSALQARVFNLGPSAALSFHTWSLDRGFLQLRATNLAGATTAPATVIDNVVSLKAQYGLDRRVGGAFTPENGMQVTLWSNSIGDADQSGVEDGADYQRVAAVRIAVVARSKNPEKPNAAGACTATPNPFTVFGGTVAVNLAVTGDTVDWKCYRYRSFETIVPMRNSAWRPTP